MRCPVCSYDEYILRNIGFIGTTWQIRAVLTGLTTPVNNGNDIKVVGQGMTYDHKLYIFEEIDYKSEFQFLEISAQKISMSSQVQQN